MLEKQKEQKSTAVQKAPPTSTEQIEVITTGQPSLPNLTVTVQNRSRFIHSNEPEEAPATALEKRDSLPPVNVAKPSDSLKKKVLLKNTISAAAATTLSATKVEAGGDKSAFESKTIEEKSQILEAAEKKLTAFR